MISFLPLSYTYGQSVKGRVRATVHPNNWYRCITGQETVTKQVQYVEHSRGVYVAQDVLFPTETCYLCRLMVELTSALRSALDTDFVGVR